MKKTILAFAAVAAMAAMPAQAATFNFADIADASGDLPDSYTALGEAGYSVFKAADEGVYVAATGSATSDDDKEQFAYLDSGAAGLGVCKDLGGIGIYGQQVGDDQCNPGNDDNVGYGESLTLAFAQEVNINWLEMRNADHGTTFAGTFDLIVESVDGDYSIFGISLAGLFSDADANWRGSKFTFLSNSSIDENSGEVFYINSMDVSPVPLPAAAWLFLSGIAGLAGFRMKKSV